MTIKIIGKHLYCKRKLVGLYSLDRAFINDEGDLGIPIGVGHEIFGVNFVGKSTFVYSLAGLLADKGIALCDFEGFDENYLKKVLSTVGFKGTVNVLHEEEDEDQLDELIKQLRKNEYSIGIVDSVGAISPISEQEDEIGAASMGRRARMMSIFSKKALHIFRHEDEDDPSTILAVNHWYPRIGSRGYDTPGGEVKKYLLSVRILLKRKNEFPDGSYILEGKVYKNRWGYKDKTFWVFMLAGRGIHPGLTALWDCVMKGKIKYGQGGWIKWGKENLGRLSKFVKSAKKDEKEPFELFYKLLGEKDGSNDKESGSDSANGNKEDNKVQD